MDLGFLQDLLFEVDIFMFCGEVFLVFVVKVLFECFLKVKIFNMYGLIEVIVVVIFVEIMDDVISCSELFLVGFVKFDMNIFIMDEQGQLFFDGEKGEIVIVGLSVS